MTDQYPAITIDEEVCAGSGDCARIAAQAFRVDDQTGLAVVLPTVRAESPDNIRTAEYECPTGAITVEWGGET